MKYVVSQEFIDTVKKLIKYRYHLSWCEYENTEFCTCGMLETLNKVNTLAKDISHYKSEN